MAFDLAKFVLHNDGVPESELYSSVPFIFADKMVKGMEI